MYSFIWNKTAERLANPRARVSESFSASLIASVYLETASSNFFALYRSFP